MSLSRIVVLVLGLVLLTGSPAHASEASDSSKKAIALSKNVDRAQTEDDRAAAEAELREYVERRSKYLSNQELGKMDTAYLGRMQSYGGMHDEAIATLQKALAHPGATKYGYYIHFFYVKALIRAGKPAESFEAWKAMKKEFPEDKRTKQGAMSVGMALRGARMWKESTVALGAALQGKNPSALKPLVNSLLMEDRKDEAIKAIDWAIETAGEAGADEAHPILRAITLKHGEKIDLPFDAFAPEEAVDTEGKVVVMGFWNVSAGSLRWTMQLLESLYQQFPPLKGVVTLGVSTYYQKDPDTGTFNDAMSPEAEREIGVSYRNQYGYSGQLAYVKDREALQALGCSAFPYVVVVGKDGTLLYAHTINRADPTELEVLREIIDKARR
jgi:tetratricopeptide (TPR) repeat protein